MVYWILGLGAAGLAYLQMGVFDDIMRPTSLMLVTFTVLLAAGLYTAR